MRICLLYLRFFVGKYSVVFSENSEAADGEVSMRTDSVGTGCNGFLDLSRLYGPIAKERRGVRGRNLGDI